jgi:hypothetical protein
MSLLFCILCYVFCVQMEQLNLQASRGEEALAAVQAALDSSNATVQQLFDGNLQYKLDMERAQTKIEALQSELKEATRYHEEVLSNAMKQQVS